MIINPQSTSIISTIIQGTPGIDGTDGEDALIIPGSPGPSGTSGKDGTTGFPGSDGLDGEDGLSIPGPQGIQGIQGSSGIQGPPGVSVFVEDGLQGEDGIFGIPGPPGNNGTSGVNGSQGLQGLPGFDGEAGEDGFLLGPLSPPTILQTISLTGQTANIADTAFSSNAVGVYRVSFFFQITTAGTGGGLGSISLNLKFTDNSSAKTLSSAAISLGSIQNYTQAMAIVRLNSGSITYGVTNSKTSYSTAVYALYLILERLI